MLARQKNTRAGTGCAYPAERTPDGTNCTRVIPTISERWRHVCVRVVYTYMCVLQSGEMNGHLAGMCR